MSGFDLFAHFSGHGLLQETASIFCCLPYPDEKPAKLAKVNWLNLLYSLGSRVIEETHKFNSSLCCHRPLGTCGHGDHLGRRTSPLFVALTSPDLTAQKSARYRVHLSPVKVSQSSDASFWPEHLELTSLKTTSFQKSFFLTEINPFGIHLLRGKSSTVKTSRAQSV